MTLIEGRDVALGERLDSLFVPEVIVRNLQSRVVIDGVTFEELSPAVTGFIDRRIKLICEIVSKKENSRDDLVVARRVVLGYLRISCWMFSVSPQITSSFRLASSFLMCLRLARRTSKKIEDGLNEEIIALGDEVCRLLLKSIRTRFAKGDWSGYVPVQLLNIVSVLCDSKDANYRLNHEVVENIFKELEEDNYFVVVTALFCSAKDSRLAGMREGFLKSAVRRFADACEFSKLRADDACLLLDLLSMPDLDIRKKRGMMRRAFGISQRTLNADIEACIKEICESEMFASWNRIDLMHSLEKKQLLARY